MSVSEGETRDGSQNQGDQEGKQSTTRSNQRSINGVWISLTRDIGRLAFSLLATFSVIVTTVLLALDELEGAEAGALLGIALLSVFLAVGGDRFIRRIAKFGVEGLELEPEERENIEGVLTAAHEPPEDIEDFLSRFLPQNEDQEWPRPRRELSPTEAWYYEVGTDLLLLLAHRSVDVKRLSSRDLELYRKLVLWIGKAALNRDEAGKALEILKMLERVEDKTPEELLHLGYAYLMMASYVPSPKVYRVAAQSNLEEAVRKRPVYPEAHFALAYVYDDQGYYEPAIQQDDEAVRQNPKFALLAYWTRAVSNVKLGNHHSAIEDLRRVPKGSWWTEICDDPELGPLNAGPCQKTFRELCRKSRVP